MRIGELASRTGVSIRSLRYYEEVGILHSRRSSGGQRHYDEDGVERVLWIQRLFAAGVSSHTIQQLLPCINAPTTQNSDAALERLEQEQEKLRRHIKELKQTQHSLNELIAIARAGREPGKPARACKPDKRPKRKTTLQPG